MKKTTKLVLVTPPKSKLALSTVKVRELDKSELEDVDGGLMATNTFCRTCSCWIC